MGHDRLAALRAQRQTDAPQPPIELQSVPAPSQESPFYAETTAIQEAISELDANVTAIADLHARSLNALSDADSAANHARLTELTESTRALSNALSNRIKALKVQQAGVSPGDAESRRNRIALIHGKFVETLQRYQNLERQYRQRYQDRVARQFKIVKPDATADEVSAVVHDAQGSSNQIFLQAISSSTRYGESRQAYHEVQERHQDIQRIETTLAELAQLFNDMSVLLAQQDDQIAFAENKAVEVEEDTRKGVGRLQDAIKHALSARRKRWICFFIIVIVILAAVGIGVGVHFGNKSSSSGG